MDAFVRRQFDWQRTFIPKIIQIVGSKLGPYLFAEAPADEDMRENTDLMILQARDIRVACRLRTSGYYERFPFDITFRSWLSSGCKTEIHKMLDGYGHAFFYGFIDGSPQDIVCWRLVSLQRMRNFFADFERRDGWTPHDLIQFAWDRGLSLSGLKMNGDEETGFVHFDIRQLEMIIPKIVIASSSPLQPQEETLQKWLTA